MPTAIETDLVEFNNWTLRLRPSRSTRARLLVLIHGLTGDENSMWVFTRGLSTDYWIMAPRAPYAAEAGGFSWRPHLTLTDDRPSLETLLPSAEGLIRLIDEYSASVKLDAQQFDLMGFSQGAAMVNLIGVVYPHRVRKMAVLAGFVPFGLDDLISRKPLSGKNIFVAHGTQDQTVPIEGARKSVELLQQAGAQVTYAEDEVGHKLSAKGLRALENYLTIPNTDKNGE